MRKMSYLIAILAIALAASLAHAQIPRYFSYQGLVVDMNTNQPIPNGTHSVHVVYFDAASGGSRLYQEDIPVVPFTRGVFDLLLGVGLAGFPETMHFDHQYWMQLT